MKQKKVAGLLRHLILLATIMTCLLGWADTTSRQNIPLILVERPFDEDQQTKDFLQLYMRHGEQLRLLDNDPASGI